MNSRAIRSLLITIILTLGLPTFGQSVIWYQPDNLGGDWGPSQQTRDAVYGTINAEVADDFDMTGTISKVAFAGYNGSIANPSVVPARFYGVFVRFYAYGVDGKPGALQAEYWVPKGDARLAIDASRPDKYTMTLQPAFQATGRHFVSPQVVMDCEWQAIWYARGSNASATSGQALYGRDRLAGGAWSHTFPYATASMDLAFTLYGTRVWPKPVLGSLSNPSIYRSGRLTLTGQNFGNEQGAGTVTIGGQRAHVVRWRDSVITCYVPEATPLGVNTVQVNGPGGASNLLSLDVTVRPAPIGRVKWRFRAHGLHMIHRPVIGPDGTIYALDAQGLLYALTPNGGLKWIHRSAGGDYGPPTVGPDGTVYVASDSVIYAVGSNGVEKWQHAGIPGTGWVIAGPSVGPDGNIYAVCEFGPAYSLTPTGQLRWTQGYYAERGSLGREIVFGPDRLYFMVDMYGTGQPGQLFGLSLGGSLVFGIGVVSGGGVEVAPDGSVVFTSYSGINRVTSNGSPLWNFPGNNVSGMTTPTISIDGTIYAVQNSYDIWSTNLAGGLRWHINGLGVEGAPVVSPANHLIAMGGRGNYGEQGWVQAVSTSGAPLWRELLPYENGNWITIASRARFSPDGQTAYFGTTINDYAADPYCYLYAIATPGGAAPPPGPAVSTLTLNPAAVTGGAKSTGTVTLSSAAPFGGAIISLESSRPATAKMPASVTVPAGARSASFTVTTGVVSTATTVAITAAYGGVTKSATLTVNPAPSSDTVRITRADYTVSKKELQVQATSTSASAILKVYMTSSGALIGTLANNGGGRFSRKFALTANPQNITVKSSLGGVATATVIVK